MADDKKNIPEAAPPAEAPAPAVENAAVPEPPAPDPVLTDAEAVMLEHEGQAALFEMGEAVPDPADAVTTPRWRSLPLPKHPRLKRNRRIRSLPARTIPPRHIPARWWISPLPVTRRPNPAEAVLPRRVRLLPIVDCRPQGRLFSWPGL